MDNVQYLLPTHYAESILRLSKKIAKLSQQHEWELAQEVEAQRNNVMQELFSHPNITESLPLISSMLYEVIELDAEVIINGEIDLNEMAGEINNLGKGKQAVNAYLKT